jgi:hypothetical protein
VKFGAVKAILIGVRGKFARNVGIFRPIEINIGTRYIYEMLLSDFYIHKNRQEKEFISILVTLVFRLCETRYKEYENNAVLVKGKVLISSCNATS